MPRTVPLCFSLLYMFCMSFLSSVLPGGPSTVRKLRPPRISRFKRTINLPRTVPLCFSLLCLFYLFFIEQYFAGRRIYNKENASAQNFAFQKDDKFAA